MRQTIPLLITFVSGTLLIVTAFLPATKEWELDVLVWFDVMAAIAFVLGAGNLLFMHLRKISDRQAGWAYSVITLIAFTVTLFVGFLKIGVPPARESEKFGEVDTQLELAEFPLIFSVNGTLPKGQLPAVVKNQLVQSNEDEIAFTGWMTANQRDQLKKFEFEKGWHDTVDALYAKAQPPKQVADQMSYHAQLGTVSIRGVMSAEARDVLLQLGDGERPQWKSAIEALYGLSNEVHAVSVAELPAGVSVPDKLKDVLTFDESAKELRFTGPMSLAQRDQLANQFPKGTILTAPEKETLRQKLEAAGPFTTAQATTLKKFAEERPSDGERNRDLYFALLQPFDENSQRFLNTPLTKEQGVILLADYRAQNDWYHTVNDLLLASHQTKYAWSGAVDAEGGAFWYLYEYAIVPLTSTMFALLGFYVASAAYRAFRAKNIEATLLLGTAFIILLGRTSAGAWLTSGLDENYPELTLPGISMTIMKVFNTAGNRAIMIGIALGIVSTSLRILLGIDRSYLGSDRK